MSTSVANEQGPATEEKSGTLILESNFPNPFNAATAIGYFIPESGHVTLLGLDITGRKVATIIDEYQVRGYHKTQWKPSVNLPSGVYYYQIISNNYIETKKCLFLK